MTRKGTIESCHVCGDTTHIIRFGAVSCRYASVKQHLDNNSTSLNFRACAEFFRREVISKSKIFYKCSRQCQLNKKIRKTCRSCRYQKCLQVGMLATIVSSRKPVIQTDCSPSFYFLGGLRESYEKLESAREKTFGSKVRHEDTNEIHKFDFSEQRNRSILQL